MILLLSPFFDKTNWQNFKPIKFCRCLKNSIMMDSKFFVSTTEASFKILHNNSALQQSEAVFPRDNILEYEIAIFHCVIRYNFAYIFLFQHVFRKSVGSIIFGTHILY